jgi:hypothetical protein
MYYVICPTCEERVEIPANAIGWKRADPWDAFELDVESAAILMCPGRANPGPEALLTFAVSDLIGDVARGLGGGGVFLGVRVRHDKVPFALVTGRAHRGLTARIHEAA